MHCGSHICVILWVEAWFGIQIKNAKKSYTFIVHVSLETEVQWVNMIVLLKRWSWKGFLSLTLGKTLHIHSSGLPGDRFFEQKVLLGRWSWKAIHWWHCGRLYCAHSLSRTPGRQCWSSWYSSFIWKIVLKRPFISETGGSLCMFV